MQFAVLFARFVPHMPLVESIACSVIPEQLVASIRVKDSPLRVFLCGGFPDRFFLTSRILWTSSRIAPRLASQESFCLDLFKQSESLSSPLDGTCCRFHFS